MALRWNPESKRFVFSDVDDVLVSCIEEHVRRLTIVGQELGWINLPTLGQVLRLGGTHAAYGHYPGYKEINEEMRDEPEFNLGLPVVPGAQDFFGVNERILAGYLTTRPKKLAALTYSELIRYGFPDRSVVGRPESIDIHCTARWKYNVLCFAAKRLGRPALIIDDSKSTCDYINEQNNPQVSALLFAGSMTPKVPNALTWSQIEQKITQMLAEDQRVRTRKVGQRKGIEVSHGGAD